LAQIYPQDLARIEACRQTVMWRLFQRFETGDPRMSIARLAMTAAVASVLMLSPAEAQLAAGPNAFEVAVIGDVPYKIPDDYAKVDRLIAAINALKPAVTLHVGDVKSGSSPCTDEVLKRAFDQIQTIESPVVYTIGDNEWVDCHRKDAGGFDPRERLLKVREIFFARPGQSLGKTAMPVESQGLVMPEFKTYVENTRFRKNGVMFLGVHVPGSNNGFEALDPVAAATEFAARNKANIAWIDTSFKLATDENAKALVMFIQADFDESRLPSKALPRESGFSGTLNAIEAGAKLLGKPVLLVHGDEHYFSVQPLLNARGKPIPGVTKLMNWGEGDVHGARITIDPDTTHVFGFSSIMVPANNPSN
jgi:hypothetical protein